ncbi:MAG: IS110 family transposase [Nitrospirae bacterium]|nr:IS110 family transposase [Nitrospirota bacterium]
MRNSNTKKIKRISEGTLLVTIDIGKGKHTGYYRFSDGAEGKIFEFSNSRSGFEDMWQRVLEAKRSRNIFE